MQIKIKKLHPDAIIPQYATDGAACFDIHANLEIEDLEMAAFNSATVFRTGLSFEIPQGYAMMVYSRSGQAFKDNVRLSNCVGVIDADYRGELRVKLTRDDHGYYQVKHGDRIAQAMVVPVERVTFLEVDKLSDTERGTGGFGSTGK